MNKKIMFMSVVALSLFSLCAGMDNSAQVFGNNQNTVSIVACEQEEGVVRDKDVLITIEDDKAPKDSLVQKLGGLTGRESEDFLRLKSKGLLKLKNGKIVARTKLEEVPADVFIYEIFPQLDIKGLQGVHQQSRSLRQEVEKFIFRVDLSKYEEDFLSRIDFANYDKVPGAELIKEFIEKITDEVVRQTEQELEKSKCKKIPLLFVKYNREELHFLNKDNVKESFKNMEKSLEKDFESLFDEKYLKLRRVMRPVRFLLGIHFFIVVPVACVTGAALGIVLACTL